MKVPVWFKRVSWNIIKNKNRDRLNANKEKTLIGEIFKRVFQVRQEVEI